MSQEGGPRDLEVVVNNTYADNEFDFKAPRILVAKARGVKVGQCLASKGMATGGCSVHPVIAASSIVLLRTDPQGRHCVT